MTLRRAILADIPAILNLLSNSPEAAQWTEAQVRQAIERDLVLVALDGQALQGCAIAHAAGPEWELENIAVAPQSRRLGIARELLQELLKNIRSTSAEALFLEVRASNQAATTLYEAAGFRQYGRRPGYYREPAEDALLYRKDFSSG